MKVIEKFKNFFKTLPDKFKAIPHKLAKKFAGAKEILVQGNGKVSASMIVMGLGQLLNKQWAKGIMLLFIQVAFIVYFVLTGATDLFGFFTLGTRAGNAWYGIEGDNSVVMLIMGILAILIIILYIAIYIANIKDAYRTQCALDTLKKPVSFNSVFGTVCSYVLQDIRLEYALGGAVNGNQLFCGARTCAASEQKMRKGQGDLEGVPHSRLCDTRIHNLVGL